MTFATFVLLASCASCYACLPTSNLEAQVTDNLIATSGPSATYPQRAYRNPLPALTKFLTQKHNDEWHIFEFRAEGTGYPDSLVANRIYHFPWPDHHPPPFALVPQIMGAMRAWLQGEDAEKQGRHVELLVKDGVKVAVVDGTERVCVGHCKAGKGRTGSMACSYLMSEEAWSLQDALDRFTKRRMRPGMGNGVSIPSQLRWLRYVERWAKHGKLYVERAVEIKEVHVWGIRDGVKVAIEGYVEDGKVIQTEHVFKKGEGTEVGPGHGEDAGEQRPGKEDGEGEKTTNTLAEVVFDVMKKGKSWGLGKEEDEAEKERPDQTRDVVYKPSKRIVLPTGDVNLATERRSKAGAGWTLVTSVAHVWFNAFFEGDGPESVVRGEGDAHTAEPKTSGVFETRWDAMDGIKGSARKGSKSFDKIAVVWSLVNPQVEPTKPPHVITEPAKGEPIQGGIAADWHQKNRIKESQGSTEGESASEIASQPGLKPQTSDSQDVSEEDLSASLPSAALGFKDRAMPDEDSSDEDGVAGIQRGLNALGSQQGRAAEGDSSDESLLHQGGPLSVNKGIKP